MDSAPKALPLYAEPFIEPSNMSAPTTLAPWGLKVSPARGTVPAKTLTSSSQITSLKNVNFKGCHKRETVFPQFCSFTHLHQRAVPSRTVQQADEGEHRRGEDNGVERKGDQHQVPAQHMADQ